MKRAMIFLYGVASYALSLGVFVYAIGFVGGFGTPTSLDAAPRRPAGIALAIDLALLAAFALQHSGMARGPFKRWWTRIIPAAAERSTYVLASSIAMLALFVLWEPIGGVVWQVAGWARVTVIGLNLAGWALLLYSTFLIDHFDLLGLAQVWRALRGTPHTEPRFHTPGLYRIVRHPLYVGWLVIFWAAPVMTAAHLVFAVMTTVYILVAVRLEERDLLKAHGADYAAWRARTPMLLPFRLLGGVVLAILVAVMPAERGVAGAVDTVSVSIRYTGAELRSADGARHVYSRIQASAAQLCAALDGAGLDRQLRFGACRRDIIERAVRQLDAPRVTAVHRGRADAHVASR